MRESEEVTRPNFNEFLSDLSQFTGSQSFHRLGLHREVIVSEGAMHVVEVCGAYWLMEDIADNQRILEVHDQEFQVWKLSVVNEKGTLTCEDGNGITVYTKSISFTDFPYPEVVLWFQNNTIFLPSEY